MIEFPENNQKKAPKKYSEPSLSSTLSINAIYDIRGNIEYTLYAAKYEDAKVIKYLKDKLKKKDSFKKAYLVFHIGTLVLYKDSSMTE